MLRNWAAGGVLRPALDLNFLAMAATGAVDPRLTISGGSGGTRVNSSGNIVSASAPRFDYDPSTLAAKGLLIEEQRTNSIRNNTMQGGAAPSTFPTGWDSGMVWAWGGITPTVAYGTESGVAYIDLTWNGATSNATVTAALLAAISNTAAASGQTWTFSSYVKLAAGAIPANLAIQLAIREYDASSVFQSQGTQAITPNNSSLVSQLPALTRTLASATTAFVAPSIRFDPSTVPIGTSVSMTLRIGLPQLEQGAFATSAIPTSGSAVTRTADSISMTGTSFLSWFNAAQGTFVVESTPANSGITGIAYHSVSVSDGTANNRILAGYYRQLGGMGATVTTGGASQFDQTASTYAGGQIRKAALAYANNDFAFVANASAAVVGATGTVPTVDRLFIGADHQNSAKLNGWVRGLRYYPARLPNATLQVMTQ